MGSVGFALADPDTSCPSLKSNFIGIKPRSNRARLRCESLIDIDSFYDIEARAEETHEPGRTNSETGNFHGLRQGDQGTPAIRGVLEASVDNRRREPFLALEWLLGFGEQSQKNFSPTVSW